MSESQDQYNAELHAEFERVLAEIWDLDHVALKEEDLLALENLFLHGASFALERLTKKAKAMPEPDHSGEELPTIVEEDEDDGRSHGQYFYDPTGM